MTIRLALGQLRAHAGRYLSTLAAITVAVAFVLTSVGVLATLSASVDAVYGARYAGTSVLVQKVGDRTAAPDSAARDGAAASEREVVAAIGATPGVRAVTVDAQTYVRMLPLGGAQRVTTATALPSDDGLRWQRLSAGRLPSAPGEVAVRADGGMSPGTTFEVRRTGDDETTTATVVGVFDLSHHPDMRTAFPIFTTAEQVQAWSDHGAGGDIRVAGDGSVQASRLADELRQRIAGIPGAEAAVVSTGSAESARLSATFLGSKASYTRVVHAFLVLAVSVAALVIATTFAVVFAARVRETALLRCLGAARWQIRVSALVETLAVAALGTAAGVALGRAGVGVATANASRLGVAIPMQEVTVPTRAVLLAIAVGLGVTLLTAAWPLWRSTIGTPLAALRPADVRPTPWWRILLLSVGGLALALLSRSRLREAVAAREVIPAGAWGVGVFLGVLVVAAAVLPALLSLVGGILGAPLGPIALLGARATARNPRRTAATAAAVLVGVTLVSAMATGSALLRPAVEQRFEYGIPLDIAVTDTGGMVPAGLPGRVAGVEGVREAVVVTDMYVKDASGKQTVLRVADPTRVAAVMHRPVTLPAPGEIVLPRSSPLAQGVPDGRAATFTFFSEDDGRDLTIRRTSDPWALAAPGSVPAWPVPRLPDGSPWPGGREIPAEFVPRTELWLRMDDSLQGTDLEAALSRVRAAASDFGPSVAVTESFQSREQVRTTVRAVLTSTVLLLAVTVLIAFLGVTNTLSLAVSERSREFALLRGVGVTRAGLSAIVVVESLLLASVTAALGVFLGAGLGRAGAVSLVGASAIGELAAPTRDLVLIWAAATLVAITASAIASLGASRTRVVDL